jgi:hypothetical protein
MEPKDWIPIIMSALALMASLLTAVFTFCVQKRWRINDSKLEVEKEFQDVQQSMAYIGLLHWQQKQSRSNLWTLAY